jgi:endonuclease YncB( thermonuclease family)
MGKDIKYSEAEKKHARHYLSLAWRKKLTKEDQAQYNKAFESARTGKLGFWLQFRSFINYIFLGF